MGRHERITGIEGCCGLVGGMSGCEACISGAGISGMGVVDSRGCGLSVGARCGLTSGLSVLDACGLRDGGTGIEACGVGDVTERGVVGEIVRVQLVDACGPCGSSGASCLAVGAS